MFTTCSAEARTTTSRWERLIFRTPSNKSESMKTINMKNIFTIAAVTAASVIAVSCAKEVAGDSGLIAHASLQPVEASKAIGQYSYNIVWEENDHITVLDANGLNGDFELVNGHGTSSGTFRYGGGRHLPRRSPLFIRHPS